MSKVWVKVTSKPTYGYSESDKAQWLIGTIVGEQTCKRYKEQIQMTDVLSGDMYWLEKRLLVETDDGVHEVWQSEVFVPAEATNAAPPAPEGGK